MKEYKIIKKETGDFIIIDYDALMKLNLRGRNDLEIKEVRYRMKTKTEKELEREIFDKREYLEHFLESNTGIDEMDYNEVLEWADNEIEDDYRNKFICEWKDYTFLRGRLEGYKLAKEKFNKKIKKFILKFIEDFEIQTDNKEVLNWWSQISERVMELEKIILTKTKRKENKNE